MASAKKDSLDTATNGDFEVSPERTVRDSERKSSGIRPVSQKVQATQRETQYMAADVIDLDWEEDTNPTGVETPQAKKKDAEKKHLRAILGDIGVGRVSVSAGDLQIWHDIESGNFSDISKVTFLIPRYARSLVEGWKISDLILGSLKTLDRSLARVFVEWEGNTLHFPAIKFVEPGALEILEQAKAERVIVGDDMLKTTTQV